MKKNSLFIFMLIVSYATHAQNKVDSATGKNFQTDVFILNSCSPGLVSFKKDSDRSEKNDLSSIRKLSLNVNRLSAFKIININPLRYSYNLENQYVTQFFDKADINDGGFINDTARLSVNDIEALQIFDIKDKFINSKDLLKDIKVRIKIYQDTLSILNTDFKNIINVGWALGLNFIIKYRTFIADKKTGKVVTQKKDSLNELVKKLDKEYIAQYRKLENEFDNVSSVIANSRTNVEQILEDIINTNTGKDLPAKYIQMIRAIDYAAIKTKQELELLNDVLDKIPSSNYQNTYSEKKDTNSLTIANLLKGLDKIKTISSTSEFRVGFVELFNDDPNNYNINNDRDQAIYSLKDFIYNQKIKVAESFVIFTSLQIGKLLQDQVIECSRFQNEFIIQTCIKDIQEKIDTNIANYSRIYTYIQNITSNLNVFINYLQLSNTAFDSAVSSINSNYRLLLRFLKTLDFVKKNNARIFTLPSHNNLRNADLIRYSIKRIDRLTGKIEPYTYDIWLKGGFKVDFSIAIFASQLTDFNYNKTPFFYGDSIQSKDSFYFRRSNDGKYSFAFGGMVNLFWRTGASWITPGFSFGVAYATTQNLQFLAAGSMQFGKTERLVAHYGVSAGIAKRLSLSELTYDRSDKKYKSYDGDEYLVRGDIANSPTPYANRFMIKPFLGISYNLSKKNALNAVGNNSDSYNNAFR